MNQSFYFILFCFAFRKPTKKNVLKGSKPKIDLDVELFSNASKKSEP